MKFVQQVTVFEVTHPSLIGYIREPNCTFSTAKADTLCEIADVILDTLKDNDAAKQGLMAGVFPGFKFWDSNERHILYKALGSFRKNWRNYKNEGIVPIS